LKSDVRTGEPGANGKAHVPAALASSLSPHAAAKLEGGDLLRLATAGSVDDGKSTLLGRLLYETKSIFDDQLRAVEHASHDAGEDFVNLALLTDGLRAEREQGITIDVAYRYFATPKRSFILADTPGHVQYTRNMVTGASTVDLTIVLVDASRGVAEQSRRHAFLSALLRVPHLVVCVNKMDLVDYDKAAFEAVRTELGDFLARLDFPDVAFIPVSALKGDNVVERSQSMPWYDGPPLLEYLESVPVVSNWHHDEARFPVQWVIRANGDGPDAFRGYAGRVVGGALSAGDEVVVLPSGVHTRVREVRTHDGPLDEAVPPMSVVVTLEDEVDLSRGDMLAHPHAPPCVEREVVATVCWLASKPLQVGGRYYLKHTTRTTKAIVAELRHKLDINTLARDETATSLALNEIGEVVVKTAAPLLYDPYSRNRTTGGFILIDEATNGTVGAGMIL
jgi:bifunctional enzyme CysN/CysC